MIVTSQVLKLHDVWLWSYSTAKHGNIFAVVSHWIPGSTNHRTIAMTKKVNFNKIKPRVCIFNDCDNSGGESWTNKEQVSFSNRLESTLHCEFVKHTNMHEYLDGCRASSIKCQQWQLVKQRLLMIGKESYWYRYSIWIEALTLSPYARPLVCKI